MVMDGGNHNLLAVGVGKRVIGLLDDDHLEVRVAFHVATHRAKMEIKVVAAVIFGGADHQGVRTACAQAFDFGQHTFR